MIKYSTFVGSISLAVLLSGCATGPKNIPFDSSSEQAMLVVEEKDGLQGGVMSFTPVDLQSKTVAGKTISISKRDDNRFRTSNKSLQTKGDGLMVAKNMTRFSPATVTPGYYALTHFWFATGVGTASGCPEGSTNVYEVKRGQVNIIESRTLPAGSSSNILKYGSGFQSSSTADLKMILTEYPAIVGDVVTAPVVASISFIDKKGKFTGCEEDTFKINETAK